jgi:hypothetical protein
MERSVGLVGQEFVYLGMENEELFQDFMMLTGLSVDKAVALLHYFEICGGKDLATINSLVRIGLLKNEDLKQLADTRTQLEKIDFSPPTAYQAFERMKKALDGIGRKKR